MPPVLACFTDQDARVRYYACEAMYNIAKVAKGEILIYFNHIFDALSKVCPIRPSSTFGGLTHTLPCPAASLVPTRSSRSRTAPNFSIA